MVMARRKRLNLYGSRPVESKQGLLTAHIPFPKSTLPVDWSEKSKFSHTEFAKAKRWKDDEYLGVKAAKAWKRLVRSSSGTG